MLKLRNFKNMVKKQPLIKNTNKLIFIQKRTMLSYLRNSTTKTIGVGVNYRNYSSWGGWKLNKNHPKGHYIAIKDDAIKNNAEMPDWKFTHAAPGIAHPKDPDVIEVHEISKTDLKGSNKPQSVAHPRGYYSKATREINFDDKLADGQPMANALDELEKIHKNNLTKNNK